MNLIHTEMQKWGLNYRLAGSPKLLFSLQWTWPWPWTSMGPQYFKFHKLWKSIEACEVVQCQIHLFLRKFVGTWQFPGQLHDFLASFIMQRKSSLMYPCKLCPGKCSRSDEALASFKTSFNFQLECKEKKVGFDCINLNFLSWSKKLKGWQGLLHNKSAIRKLICYFSQNVCHPALHLC